MTSTNVEAALNIIQRTAVNDLEKASSLSCMIQRFSFHNHKKKLKIALDGITI
jgi:hypothetical protein